jgi:glycosyltransferase involved in cell wall biosynthesis
VAAGDRTRALSVVLVSRFAWPAIGGMETVLRTLSSFLATRADVRVVASRIDDRGTAWPGPLDRVPAWDVQVDPTSGVATEPFSVSDRRLVALARVMAQPHRVLGRLGRTPVRFDRRYAGVAGSELAEQISRADVLHRFGGNRLALACVRAARHLDVPLVISPFAHPGQYDDDPTSAAAYRAADLVVATTASDAETYARLGVGDRQLAICPPGTEMPPRGGGPALRADRGIDGPLVLFLGARRAHKGVDLVLGAASRLRGRHPDARFAFVGPGDPLPAAPPAVLDVGPVGEREHAAWLDAADIVCLPSAQESFGMAVSEAWSVGCPVVTSDIPVLRERVSEAGGGLAVPRTVEAVTDALEALLDDEARRMALGAAGRRYWERRLSPRAFGTWHLAAYETLRASAPGPAGRGLAS